MCFDILTKRNCDKLWQGHGQGQSAKNPRLLTAPQKVTIIAANGNIGEQRQRYLESQILTIVDQFLVGATGTI